MKYFRQVAKKYYLSLNSEISKNNVNLIFFHYYTRLTSSYTTAIETFCTLYI